MRLRKTKTIWSHLYVEYREQNKCTNKMIVLLEIVECKRKREEEMAWPNRCWKHFDDDIED